MRLELLGFSVTLKELEERVSFGIFETSVNCIKDVIYLFLLI